MASSLASTVCSLHVSPLSDLRITISLSRPRKEPKCGTSIMTGLQRIKIGLSEDHVYTMAANDTKIL